MTQVSQRALQIPLSPELLCRLAAIDIGTNSIRLIVAEPLRGGSYRIVDEEKFPARLGKSLSRSGRLDREAADRALLALRHMKEIAAGFQVVQLRTIATCAVREAENGGEFCRRAREEVGLEVEVISAEREARLAFNSVQRSFDLTDKPTAVVDIGGGSTEIVLAHGNMIEAIYSTQLGAVRLSETFGRANLAGDGFRKLVKTIDRHLRQRARRPIFTPHLMYGSGGTFTALAAMVMAAKGDAAGNVRGYQVSRAEVKHLVDRVRSLPLKLRGAVPGLSPDRADIIVAGLAIVDRVMRHLGVNTLQVHNRGVRDGLLLAMIDELPHSGQATPSDRDAAIDRLAARCGVDLVHARHVAHLAALLFRQLREPFQLDPQDEALLTAAARLRDVGYLIDYDRHHKHSYHLILNSRLPGFSASQLELVAHVARYHRGSPPKQKHPPFAQLREGERARVCRLAGILRIAGALDRSHAQRVWGVEAFRAVDGDGLEIRALAPEPPQVDLWSAQRSAELFERAFAVTTHFGWQAAAGGVPGNGRPGPSALDHAAAR